MTQGASRLLAATSLRQLQIFAALARTGSYTRTAEALMITQPTVSMQVRKLEAAVGMPLVERVGRRLYLTEAGEALRRAAATVLEALEALDMEVSELRGLATGHLRVAVVTTAKYFVPRLLGDFCRRYPDIEVALKVTNRARILERMQANEDDLYIMARPPVSEEFRFRRCAGSEGVLIAPPDHPLAGARDIPLSRLATEPFVVREPGSGTRMLFDEIFSGAGLSPPLRMEIGSNEAIKQAVAGGLGLALLCRDALDPLVEGGPVELDVQGFPLPWQWHLGHPAGKRPSPAARAFLDFLHHAQD